ncbi:hypothetical protein Rsub_10764 [Raphidocelis subcapitata]|uniref:Nucleoplasmin-like domain-containing protein n=1 Tax=Raphidocelis subcapitata TaxID=307507 RepID=A0A2V0PFR0_9CHLO|nr:hypothetical protein Rsub_10764 [Raphidocelis subcapitata]|eukprot:GBF98369.1 hypothetical protein Rsub_10764 [Raphidocelis subcapitata]
MGDEGDGVDTLEFWGEEVPPGGKLYAVEVENEPPVYHMVHVTGCALGDAPAKGPHVLKALNGRGKHIALATLDAAGARQAQLDFGISRATTFVNTGASPVFISGYVTRSMREIEGSDEEEDESEEEDSEAELEDSDAEDRPLARALNGLAKKKKRASPFLEEEAEETSEEESSDQEMEDDVTDEGEEGSSDEEDDEGEEGGSSGEGEEESDDEGDEFDRRLGAKSFREDEDGGLPQLDSDDLIAEADSDADEDEEDEDEEDDSSDEAPEEKKSTAKRPAPASTPQPAKKAKPEQPRVPASAPPKVQQQKTGGKQQQQQAGGGDAESRFLSGILDLLRTEGKPVPIALIGTKVKRPEGVAKLKPFILAHGDRLAYDEKSQMVSAKK